MDSQLEQVGILNWHSPKSRWPIAATAVSRRLPAALKKLLKRRQVVEPMIGHMKADGLLGRNWLKGVDGDALHALLCGAGHNLRMLLRYLRVLCLLLQGGFRRLGLPTTPISSPSLMPALS